MKVKNVGILTGGGDCPGLNAVIRTVYKTLKTHKTNVIGILDGFEGLIEGKYKELLPSDISGILHRGGTIIGTSNIADPFKYKDRGNVSGLVVELYKKLELDCLVAVGGNGTMDISSKLSKLGMRIMGIPKTIDNDLEETDICFGFDTAVQVVSQAIDALHSTADSHHRIMVVETMGRTVGWIALYAGVAAGADSILIPEFPFSFDALSRSIIERYKTSRFTLIAVSEGSRPKDGRVSVSRTVKGSPDPIRLGGISNYIAREVERMTGHEARVTILGHLQRSGSPTAFDRLLATQYAHAAVEGIYKGKFNAMVALKKGSMTYVPLRKLEGKVRMVPGNHPLINVAKSLNINFGI